MGENSPKPNRGNAVKTVLQLLVQLSTNGVLLGMMLFGWSIWQAAHGGWERFTAFFSAPQPQPQVDMRSLVVQQVRDMSDLTTAAVNMETVVPTHQDRTVAGWRIGQTKLLYIARGEVRAGIDLGELQTQDVQVQDGKVQVKLPPPRVLDTKLDVSRSAVYDYDRGFLSLGPDVAPNLQTLAQRTALQRMTANACTKGLLTAANTKAEQVITQLLTTTGYQSVIVQTQAPTAASCAPLQTVGMNPASAPPESATF